MASRTRAIAATFDCRSASSNRVSSSCWPRRSARRALACWIWSSSSSWAIRPMMSPAFNPVPGTGLERRQPPGRARPDQHQPVLLDQQEPLAVDLRRHLVEHREDDRTHPDGEQGGQIDPGLDRGHPHQRVEVVERRPAGGRGRRRCRCLYRRVVHQPAPLFDARSGRWSSPSHARHAAGAPRPGDSPPASARPAQGTNAPRLVMRPPRGDHSAGPFQFSRYSGSRAIG